MNIVINKKSAGQLSIIERSRGLRCSFTVENYEAGIDFFSTGNNGGCKGWIKQSTDTNKMWAAYFWNSDKIRADGTLGAIESFPYCKTLNAALSIIERASYAEQERSRTRVEV